MQFTPQAASGGRLSLPLHGLRGIAVLFVLFSHLGNAGMGMLPIAHDAIGKVGVWIFFSLSSFLLTRGLCQALSRERSPGQALLGYGIHRVMRIYPLYVVVLLLHGLLGDMSGNSIVRHLMLQEGVHELWAIPVEFKYYLIVPLVALAALQVSRVWLSACLLAGVLVSFGYGLADPRAVFSIELDLLPKIAPFLLGSLLALWVDLLSCIGQTPVHSAQSIWLPRLLSPAGQVLLWVAFLSVTVLFRAMIKAYIPYSLAPLMGLLIAICTVSLILVCLHQTWTAAFLRSRVLVFLGEISFSLYLLHMFIVHAMERWGAGMSAPVQGWLALLLCLPVSVLTWRFIERPGIRAGRYLADRLGGVMGQRCYS